MKSIQISSSSLSSLPSLTSTELLRIKQLYTEYSNKGKKNSELLSRCYLELPKRNKKDIEIYIEYLNKYKYIGAKKKSLKLSYESEIISIKQKAILSIQQCDLEMLEQYKSDIEFITMSIQQEKLHTELANMRLIKYEQQLVLDVEQKRKQEEVSFKF
jgi:hypothetical protein